MVRSILVFYRNLHAKAAGLLRESTLRAGSVYVDGLGVQERMEPCLINRAQRNRRLSADGFLRPGRHPRPDGHGRVPAGPSDPLASRGPSLLRERSHGVESLVDSLVRQGRAGPAGKEPDSQESGFALLVLRAIRRSALGDLRGARRTLAGGRDTDQESRREPLPPGFAARCSTIDRANPCPSGSAP